ncbi:Cytochrome P450 [Amycolatopsis xylanica]|uniref:Cytochrome P450 n=1 Tax=Amycolatopsis xylanica TaxID=589385 RepID=A0A1H3JTA0_9PSEU|nr:cytochrome P450 [Amycolatopsis xylanica]SDY43167.1 Cytochrome P450 [Amycolatopsis xylanica]
MMAGAHPTQLASARLSQDFDHHDRELTPDMAVLVHRALREGQRVAYSRAHGGMWILSRYDDVEAALKDHRTFSSAEGVLFPRTADTPRFAPLDYDPPEQAVFRELMRPPCTIGAVRRLKYDIAKLVRRVVEPLVRRGGGDLVTELAATLPLAAVSLAVGFSEDARERIAELAAIGWTRMPSDGPAERFWPPFAELFRAEIKRAKAEPGEDYLSALVRSRIDGRPVTESELHAMLVSFAVAGHETTMNSLSHLLWQLGERPDLQSRLRGDRRLIPVAIEETLRLWSPVDHGTRVTTREVTIADVVIPSGARVVLLTGAANRDPRRFAAPDEFRLDRGPVHHLGFGAGIHFCIGAHLARLEFETVLAELARHPDYRLLNRPIRYFHNGRHACLDRLDVTWP